ncbi:unnamed protein product [Caenorhabditis sp. 36 PRJEB53466]|nr:unnamed protein product [Caenorhabditis sp. 36 PRJEB53466]
MSNTTVPATTIDIKGLGGLLLIVIIVCSTCFALSCVALVVYLCSRGKGEKVIVTQASAPIVVTKGEKKKKRNRDEDTDGTTGTTGTTGGTQYTLDSTQQTGAPGSTQYTAHLHKIHGGPLFKRKRTVSCRKMSTSSTVSPATVGAVLLFIIIGCAVCCSLLIGAGAAIVILIRRKKEPIIVQGGQPQILKGRDGQAESNRTLRIYRKAFHCASDLWPSSVFKTNCPKTTVSCDTMRSTSTISPATAGVALILLIGGGCICCSLILGVIALIVFLTRKKAEPVVITAPQQQPIIMQSPAYQ